MTSSDATLLRRLLRQARPYGPHLGLLFATSLIGAPLALLVPLPIQIVVDNVLGGKPLHPMLARFLPDGVEASAESLLLAACVAIVAVALLAQLQALCAWVLQTWIGERLVLGFRARLFDHLQRLSLSFHHEQGTADSIYRLQFDAPSIQSVSVYGLIPFATAFVKVVALLIVTTQIDGSLAFVALGGGVLLFALTQLYRSRLRRRWKEARETESGAMAVVQETLAAVRVVKAFGQEEHENRRYADRADAGLRATVRAVLAHGTFDLLVGIVTGAGAAVILYLGARHVQAGVLTLGELLLVIAYLSQLFTPLRELGTRLADMQRALASAERVFARLDERPEAEERKGARSLERAHGAFRFENVTFGYLGGAPVMRDVTLEVPAGSRVGIAGRTGSGKSTLLSLLPRFYDPQAGVIRLDGVDLRDFRLQDLRAQYAIVLQEAMLFSTTIRENIAYGRPNAGPAAIEQAARDAAAHDFIMQLPGGYETQVGDRGMRLSGGERQRISIARAFLQDAPVLLLDEPTSALDTGTEGEVMDAIERLMSHRTTFIIAHRLSTLEGCDVRLQIEDGHVIKRGDDLSEIIFR